MSTYEIIDYMLSIDKQLKLAYELLHEYRTFNEVATIDNASEWFDELVLKFQSSGITELIPAWKLLQNWREEIINYFIRVNGYRISNGPMERVNRDIKTLFRLSFGTTNFERMRNRIMYSLNSDSPILYNRKQKTNKRNMRPRGPYKKNNIYLFWSYVKRSIFSTLLCCYSWYSSSFRADTYSNLFRVVYYPDFIVWSHALLPRF